MTSVHPLLRTFPRIQPPKSPTIFSHFNHTLPTFHHHGDACSSIDQPPQNSTQYHAKIVSTQVSDCGNLHELNQIFAHVIRTHFLDLYPASFHWNNVIRSYARLGSPSNALNVYIAMSRAGVLPDCYTLPIVLKAASHSCDLTMARQLHAVATKHALESNMFCESGLIGVYCKAGEFGNARKVFDQNPERQLGSWNAMIAGLSQGGRSKDAMEMFLELKRNGFEPDDVTMVSITSACGSFGDLNLALQLHRCVFHAKTLEKPDILMMNSLIDMYGKCGKMDLAYRVFSEMIEKNVSSWTSMIVGYATHGHVNKAFECFFSMREAGVRPNEVTFVAILTACVHGGMVEEGKRYFEMMKNEYNIAPQLQHYGCMVDLLGRTGMLEEAAKMVVEMPMRANVVVWGCLMGACEKHVNVEIGEWVAKHLQELEPWSDGSYVVLSNIYASRGLWRDVERVRRVMKERKLAKIPGYSLGG